MIWLHGSANAVAMRGELVALADGLGGVKLLNVHLVRRGGRIATFLLNFVDAGISRTRVESLIHDAFTYTTPTLSPRVLYVLDDNHHDEHSEDPLLTQSILEELSLEFSILPEPLDGLSPADLDGYDLVWFANPGWYVEDAASVDTLISFSAQGGGIVLQGDDMTHHRTDDSLLNELTGLRFVSNGTRTCGVQTDNQLGSRYEVQVQEEFHPLIRSSIGAQFLYGDDIDHSVPMGIGETILAWATLSEDPSCNVRTPVIVAFDPSPAETYLRPAISIKNQGRLGTKLLPLRDGDVVGYDINADEAVHFLEETIFRSAHGTPGSNEEIDALHYIPSSGHYLISTKTDAYIGQPLTFMRKGDLVAYDPLTDQAQLIFSQDQFRKADGSLGAIANTDAVYMDPQGLLYLSTAESERLGSAPNTIFFEKGDLILYDPSED
jgi:hypothetical protein